MSTSQALHQLLTQNRAMNNRALAQLTEENRHLRLSPESASAGFMLQHLAESIFPILHHTLGAPMPEGLVLRTTRGTKDEGQAGDPTYIQALADQAFAHAQSILATLTDAQLEETVETKYWGTLTRAEVFGLIMYHNAYHIGQAMLAIKRGRVQEA